MIVLPSRPLDFVPFAGNQQMPIFSNRYQREVRLIQSLKSGQHFATSTARIKSI